MGRTLSGDGLSVRSVRLPHIPGHGIDHLPVMRCGVYVLDASPNHLAAAPLIERIRDRYPDAELLVVKETLHDEEVFPYLRMGARGIVRYVDAPRLLARAVKTVAKGEFWLSPRQLGRFVDWLLAALPRHAAQGEPGYLSRRERQVLLSILQGLSNKEIGTSLHISESTVKFHVSHVLQKFGAQRRTDLLTRQGQLWPMAS
jgi:DNA-binding NarL/FixJ family response regulator